MSDATAGDEAEGREDADGDVADDAGNRLVGAIPRNVVDYIARQIVDEPDAVVVEADEGRGRIDLRLHVAPDDMGKIIGKRGRVAQAIRTVVRAAGAREGVEASVDIVD
ncbi:MAG TPA: KH domain-containing protein [Acidimicrobiales bacterium]|nr:KH domain-containing protein [Acidimicrobiales bacterium]